MLSICDAVIAAKGGHFDFIRIKLQFIMHKNIRDLKSHGGVILMYQKFNKFFVFFLGGGVIRI